MASPSTAPSLDPEETAALEQLERAEQAATAKPTPRVVARARVLLDRLLRCREIAEGRRDLGIALDEIHRAVRESGEPELTAEEIDAEIRAVRAERASRATRR